MGKSSKRKNAVCDANDGRIGFSLSKIRSQCLNDANMKRYRLPIPFLLFAMFLWGLAGFTHAQQPPAVSVDTAPPAVDLKPMATVEDIVATPVATPLETTPTLNVETPPLGFDNVLALVKRAETSISDMETTGTLPTQSEAVWCIDQAARYLGRLDKASRRGLADYRWVSLGSRVVLDGKGNTKTYRAGSVQQGVTAIRIRARRGDVYVESIQPKRTDSLVKTIRPDQWVRKDLPRRPVYFLDRPSDVQSVDVVVKCHPGDEKARLSVDLGFAAEREYVLESAAACRNAYDAIRQGDRARALEELAYARKALEERLAQLNPQ
jgi:hypothetical protein